MLDQAQRRGDLARAGEISYGVIPNLEKALAEAEGATAGAMLREEVTAEDIASVHLANDTSLIQGEKLQKAIADATSAVTKRALPDSVFAPA